MTAEFLTVCTGLAALTAYAWWATASRAGWKRKATSANDDLAAARICRDAAQRERDTATAALETLRTTHKLDKDETWEQRLVDLTKQADDAVALAHAEQLRRVESERPAVCDYLEAWARGQQAARLVLDADNEPTVAPVVPMERWV